MSLIEKAKRYGSAEEFVKYYSKRELPYTKDFFITRQELGEEFEALFDKEDFPGLATILGSDWGWGRKISTPGLYYEAAVKLFRAKYPLKPEEVTNVRRYFKTRKQIDDVLTDIWKQAHTE